MNEPATEAVAPLVGYMHRTSGRNSWVMIPSTVTVMSMAIPVMLTGMHTLTVANGLVISTQMGLCSYPVVAVIGIRTGLRISHS